MADNILNYWGVSVEELSKVVLDNPSLRGIILGYLAESKLRKYFENKPKVTSLRKDDDHDRKKKGDLVVTYCGHEFRFEVKSLQTNMVKNLGENKYDGRVQCDASDRRKINIAGSKSVETTCLLVGEFDILAACLFAFRDKWDYGFALNRDLPRSTFKKYPPAVRKKLLKSLVPVTWPLSPPFVSDPFVLMDQLVEEREHSK